MDAVATPLSAGDSHIDDTMPASVLSHDNRPFSTIKYMRSPCHLRRILVSKSSCSATATTANSTPPFPLLLPLPLPPLLLLLLLRRFEEGIDDDPRPEASL